MDQMRTIEQSNGTKLPFVGLGTWLTPDHEQLKAALRAALDCGYRYIDTASRYENEHVIGEVLQEFYDAGKLKREDVWIVTKLPFHGHEPELAEQLIQRSLKNLRTDYLDLYLLHTPLPFKPKDDVSGAAVGDDGKFIPLDVPLIDTYRVLEKHYKLGVLKSIGVSNFNQQQLQDLYEKAEVKPHNLQIELHILWPQRKMIDLCKRLGITLTSFSTLGSPGRAASPASRFVAGDCLGHPVVQQLAAKYAKTPAQILLRHTIQQGISVIPKSVSADRLKQNIDVFDFELAAADQKKLADIDEKEHVRLHLFDFAEHHPNYPF